MFDMYLLIWQAATSDAARALGMDQAMTAAVIFLLVKELLDWIGKFMPGLSGRGSANGNGHSAEYWQEIIANRTAAAVRSELRSAVEKIDRIAEGVTGLVRSDEDRRLGRVRTRASDDS